MKLKQTYRGNNFEILLVTNMFGKHFLCNKNQMCETDLKAMFISRITTLYLMQMLVLVLNRENPGHGIKKIAVKTESKEEKKWRGERM